MWPETLPGFICGQTKTVFARRQKPWILPMDPRFSFISPRADVSGTNFVLNCQRSTLRSDPSPGIGGDRGRVLRVSRRLPRHCSDRACLSVSARTVDCFQKPQQISCRSCVRQREGRGRGSGIGAEIGLRASNPKGNGDSECHQMDSSSGLICDGRISGQCRDVVMPDARPAARRVFRSVPWSLTSPRSIVWPASMIRFATM